MAYIPALNVQRHVNDPTDWGTSASRGLLAGLQQIQQQNDAKRAFRNDVAAKGGVMLDTDSPERQRLNAIVSRFKKRPTWLGGTGGHATADEAAAAEANVQGTPDVSVTPNYAENEAPVITSPRPAFDEQPRTPAQPVARNIRSALAQQQPTMSNESPTGPLAATPQPGQNLSGARDGTAVGTAQPVRTGRGIAALLDQATSGVHPYDVEGPDGMKATIDPMYGARVEAAGKMLDYGFERAARQDEKDQSDEDAINALVAGGVPRAEARARVLTGTVKYDQTYGQQPRGGSLTFDQRVQLEQLRQHNATERIRLAEGMRTARKNNDPVAMARLNAQLRALDQRDREITLRLGGIELSQEKDPTGVAAVVEGSTPEGQAAATARAGRRRGIVEGLKHAVEGGTGGSGNTPQPTVPLGRRMAQLKAQGKNAAQAKQILVSEGYTLPKGW